MAEVRTWGLEIEGVVGDLEAPSFPTGATGEPGIAIGQPESGIAQLFADSLSIINEYQGAASQESHGFPLFTHRGSLLLGSRSDDGDNRYPNQSALEIVIQNDAEAAAVPLTIHQNAPDSASVEPIVLRRGRAESITGTEVAAVAGDSAFAIQGQVDDGLGTANVALGNILMGIQSGTTPTPGNVKGYAGDFKVALSPGDGVTAITTVLQLLGTTGNMNLVSGALVMGSVNTVIDSSRKFSGAAYKSNVRTAIADDAAYTLALPGGATGGVLILPTGTPSATVPCAMIFFRVSSSVAPQKCWATDDTNFRYTTGALNGTTTLSGGGDSNGFILFSSDGAGNAYIQNRLGASITVQLIPFVNAT